MSGDKSDAPSGAADPVAQQHVVDMERDLQKLARKTELLNGTNSQYI
jgi:hypothetical protein